MHQGASIPRASQTISVKAENKSNHPHIQALNLTDDEFAYVVMSPGFDPNTSLFTRIFSIPIVSKADGSFTLAEPYRSKGLKEPIDDDH